MPASGNRLSELKTFCSSGNFQGSHAEIGEGGAAADGRLLMHSQQRRASCGQQEDYPAHHL